MDSWQTKRRRRAPVDELAQTTAVTLPTTAADERTTKAKDTKSREFKTAESSQNPLANKREEAQIWVKQLAARCEASRGQLKAKGLPQGDGFIGLFIEVCQWQADSRSESARRRGQKSPFAGRIGYQRPLDTIKIGEGTTFTVYRRYDNGSILGRKPKLVVMKDPKIKFERGGQVNDRDKAAFSGLLVEIRVLSQESLRSHENIVRLLDIRWDHPDLYRESLGPTLYLEYAEFGTLADFCESDHPLRAEASAVRSILINIWDAIDVLHSCSIIHGDLKPSNVLIFEDGLKIVAKISDFGCAMFLLEQTSDKAELVGRSPPWDAPEAGSEIKRHLLVKTDVYSYGLLYWWLQLGGQDPFSLDSEEISPLGLSGSRADKLDALKKLKQTEDLDAKMLQSVMSSHEEKDADFDGLYDEVKSIGSLSLRKDPEERNLGSVSHPFTEVSLMTSYAYFADLASSKRRIEPKRENATEKSFASSWLQDSAWKLPLRHDPDEKTPAKRLVQILKQFKSDNIESAGNIASPADVDVLLFRCYLEGYGVPRSYNLAASYLRDAADLGLPSAQAIAKTYFNAIDYELADDNAVRYCVSALLQGCNEPARADKCTTTLLMKLDMIIYELVIEQRLISPPITNAVTSQEQLFRKLQDFHLQTGSPSLMQTGGTHTLVKDLAERLVKAGADSNQAVSKKDIRESLIQGELTASKAENLDFRDFNSPLSYAIWIGDLDTIKFLLEAGAFPDVVCLHMAAASHRIDILDALTGCKTASWPNIEDCNLGNTTLLDSALLDSPFFGYSKRFVGTGMAHEASLKKTVRFLLDRCSDASHLMTPYKMTFYLLQCCRFGITDVELFQWLIYPKACGPYSLPGHEFLHTAVVWNQLAIVKHLLDLDCQGQDSYGFGPSHVCATWPVAPEIYLHLKAHGIDFNYNQRNRAGTDLETPFQMAVACHNVPIANWLFENGSSRDDMITSSTDQSENCTLLGWFIRMNWSESKNSVYYLMEEYVDKPLPNFIVTPTLGRSALQEAARCSPTSKLGEQDVRDRITYLVLKYPGSRHLEYQRIDDASSVQSDTQNSGMVHTLVDGKPTLVRNAYHFNKFIGNYPVTKEKEDNGTALHFAVRAINYPAVEALLESGADGSAMMGAPLPDSFSISGTRGASTYAVKENCYASTVLDFALLMSDRLQSELLAATTSSTSNKLKATRQYQRERIQDIMKLLQRKQAANSVTFIRKRREKEIFQERREKGNRAAFRIFKGDVKEGFSRAWKIYKDVKKEAAEEMSIVTLTPESAKINAANKLLRQGRLDEAMCLYQEAQEMFRAKSFYSVNADYSVLLMNMAVVYSEQENFAAAEKLYEEALSGQESNFGSEDPRTLTCVHNFGSCFIRQGKPEEAELLVERAYSGRKKVLGPKDPETLDALVSVGTVRLLQERLAEAETAYQQAFHTLEIQIGLDDSCTLRAMYHLGLIYSKTRRWAEAKQILEKALAGRELTLGIAHIDTINTVDQLFSVLKELGDVGGAIRLGSRALVDYQEKLGFDAAKVTNMAYTLGEIYQDLLQWDDAISNFQLALAGEEKRLGRDHSSTLMTVAKLAATYKSKGLHEKAIQMEIRALGGYQALFDFDNSNVTNTAYRLGELYSDMNQWNQAISMYRLALGGEEARLGHEHNFTLLTVTKLASSYSSQGLNEKATEMEKRALRGYQKNLPFDDVKVTNAAYRLGGLHLKLQQFDESISMYQLSLKGEEKRLGPDDTSTLLTVRKLAEAYHAQGSPKKAIELRIRVIESKEKGTSIDDKVFLDTHWNLGLNYQSIDQGKSRFHYKTATDGYEILLGVGHRETLDGYTKLGKVCREMSDLVSAEHYFRKAQDGFTSTLGSEHEETLKAIDELASILYEMNRTSEGKSLLEDALQKRKVTLGFDHEDTIKNANKLEHDQPQTGRQVPIQPGDRQGTSSSISVAGQPSLEVPPHPLLPVAPVISNDPWIEQLVGGLSPSRRGVPWNLETIGTMILEGLPTESTDFDGITPLLWAAEKGYSEVVLLLIQTGADVNKANLQGRTPLHLASQSDNEEVVSQLIFKGALIDAKDNDGMTAVHHAAFKGQTFILKILLDGIDARGKAIDRSFLELMNNEGLTPLHLACIGGNVATAKFLLERGADANQSDGPGGYTPVLLSAMHGHTEVLELLIGTGVDVETVSHAGLGAFHYATASGNADMVQLLLESGADIEAKSLQEEWTPLAGAVSEGHTDIAIILMQCGASSNVRDAGGRTPLHLAANKGREEIIGLLIEEGADVGAADDLSRTPLHHAAIGGNTEIIKALLNLYSQDVHAKDKNGATPLHFAAVQGHVAAVEVILDSAAQVDAQDSAGMTPMHHAAVNGKIEVIRTLLSRGANSSIESNEGMKAVNYASNHNHLAVALILSLASSTP